MIKPGISVSLKDIAVECGVSVMTVSRVINDHPYVSAATKARVNQAIRKKKYVRNLLARSLSSGNSLNLVGIITGIPDILSKGYFVEILRNIECHLEQGNYGIFIFNLTGEPQDSSFKLKLELLKELHHGRLIKAFISIGPAMDDTCIKSLAKSGAYGITIGNKQTFPHFGHICVDNRDGVRQILAHLTERGHKRIAAVAGPSNLTSAVERRDAFIEFMKRSSLPLPENYLVNGGFTREGGRLAAARLLNLKRRPTAIFAMNDEMAVGIYDEAASRGIRIPEDLSVCGFDNIESAASLNPALTTVSQPYAEIGKQAAESIIHARFDIRLSLPMTLALRDSVARIR